MVCLHALNSGLRPCSSTCTSTCVCVRRGEGGGAGGHGAPTPGVSPVPAVEWTRPAPACSAALRLCTHLEPGHACCTKDRALLSNVVRCHDTHSARLRLESLGDGTGGGGNRLLLRRVVVARQRVRGVQEEGAHPAAHAAQGAVLPHPLRRPARRKHARAARNHSVAGSAGVQYATSQPCTAAAAAGRTNGRYNAARQINTSRPACTCTHALHAP